MNALLILTTIVLSIYAYYKWAFSYWKRKKVPYPKPSIPFGNWSLKNYEHHGFRVIKRYIEFKTKGCKHYGSYFITRPIYIPIDPDYVKNILSTDYQYFMDRGTYYNKKSDPLAGHLFNLEGSSWKRARVKLTPTFSSVKMKLMFSGVLDSSRQLKTAVDEHFHKGLPIDSKEVFASYTTDVIGSCVFGISCNSFLNPNSDFRQFGRRSMEIFTKIDNLFAIIGLANQKLALLLNLTQTPTDLTNFFVNLVKDTIEYREKNNVRASDFMQILIDQKNSEDSNERFTIEEMAAHSVSFFFAGFETSSNTMAMCLYELSNNQHLQDKVREEINTVLSKYNGEIVYEAIGQLKYFDQVIEETLRKYPALVIIPRVCVKDYKIPGTKVIIDKGTSVMIPVMGLHYDPYLYPNPEVFDPERFSIENKKNMQSYTYLPFGAGPKTCLGMRFSFTQIKVGLVRLLTQYKFSLNKKTKQPLEYETKYLAFVPNHPIFLNLEKIFTV